MNRLASKILHKRHLLKRITHGIGFREWDDFCRESAVSLVDESIIRASTWFQPRFLALADQLNQTKFAFTSRDEAATFVYGYTNWRVIEITTRHRVNLLRDSVQDKQIDKATQSFVGEYGDDVRFDNFLERLCDTLPDLLFWALKQPDARQRRKPDDDLFRLIDQPHVFASRNTAYERC